MAIAKFQYKDVQISEVLGKIPVETLKKKRILVVNPQNNQTMGAPPSRPPFRSYN